jgi:uncharacterized repeat protein (TIGR01451 family)
VPGDPYVNTFSITTADVNTNPRTSGSLQRDDPGPVTDVVLTSVAASATDGLPLHAGGDVLYDFVVTNNSTVAAALNVGLVLTLTDIENEHTLSFDRDQNPGWVAHHPTYIPYFGVSGDETLSIQIGDLAPGESRTVPLLLRPVGSVAMLPAIVFHAAATADVYELDPSNNAMDVSTPLAAGADVRIGSVVVNPNPIHVGDDLTYKATIENHGPDPATGVVLNQTLPAGTTFVSATFNGDPIAGSVADGVLSIALPDDRGSLVVTLSTAGVATTPATTLSGPIDLTWNELPGGSRGVYTLGTVIPADALAIKLEASQTAV